MNIRKLRHSVEIFIGSILFIISLCLSIDLFVSLVSYFRKDSSDLQFNYVFTINKFIIFFLAIGLFIWINSLLEAKRKLQSALLLQLRVYLSIQEDYPKAEIEVGRIVDSLIKDLGSLGYKNEIMGTVEYVDILLHEKQTAVR